MLNRLLVALIAGVSIAQSGIAGTQSSVTPFTALKSRLAIRPGQTYLSFMEKQVKPALDAYEQTILNDPATKANQYSRIQSDLIAEGAGVAIWIDGRNYIFNVGYLNGSGADDIKSGRSYGVGPTGRQSDPSDLAYLAELEAYLKSEPQSVGNFVETLMRVITYCDASGWQHLSPQGQVVATDFLAIYTAELDRHLMVQLDPRKHPWEIDLAAATFVSIFSASTGLIMQNNSLVHSSIQNWWAKGAQGSGIGETRRDRIALQHLIAREEGSSPEAQELLSMIGNPADGDVIQDVMEYLNSPSAPAVLSIPQAKALTSGMRDYLVHMQAHSGEIANLR